MTMYKIFIVEDDEMIAAGLKRHLENWGYKVTCAQDLANIMPEFVHAAPQLVLMDIKLPKRCQVLSKYAWKPHKY